jgi:bla regulator protein BlaR1
MRRRVFVFASPLVSSPAAYGWLRARVVLPAALAREASGKELEHVFLHELAHVARGDLFVQGVFGALNLVFWFHPLIWMARRRAQAVRELCCDATVASVLREETPAYRATLLRAASRLLAPVRPTPGLAGFLGGPAHIIARLKWLERGEWVLSRRKRVANALVVTLLALTVVPLAQAAVVDPAIAALEADLRAAEARVRTIQANPDSTGCLELRWSFLRWMALEQHRRAGARGAEQETGK